MKKRNVALMCCALSLIAAASQARNTRLLLPIEEVIASKKAQTMIGKDVKLYFGDKQPETAGTVIGEISSHAEAKPYTESNSGHRRPREDEPTCQDAMRMALADLTQQAHARGGDAVVEVVSFYNRLEMRSNDVYECHAGASRAVVDLKGKVMRSRAAETGK